MTFDAVGVWSDFWLFIKKLSHHTVLLLTLIKNQITIFILKFWLEKIQFEIKFDQVWSSLNHFGHIWSKKIKNKTVIFILSVNVTTFYSNIYWLVRNPIWSSLIKSDPFWTDLIQKNQKQNSHFYPFCKCDNFL